MSLFSKLLRLRSTEKEEFHTEIVAQVLRQSTSLTFRWLKTIHATSFAHFEELRVSSQEELDPLSSHEGIGSRPDIVIRIIQGDQIEVVFVESKIGSTENPGQLQKYAEHLEAQNATTRCLVFITRDYEPKEPPDNTHIEFVQQRWSDFYRFLKQQPIIDAMTSELLKFMEENNMSQSNQFTAVDILALTNFTKARTLMDHTIRESVARKFRKICGAKCSDATVASTQLRKFKRYTLYCSHGGQIEVHLGYWIDDTSIGNCPTIAVRMFVNPTAASSESPSPICIRSRIRSKTTIVSLME